MPDSQIIHRLLVLGALSSTALAAACGGDSSKANDSNTADDSAGSATTTSGATGPGAGGSEASATATGGSSTTDSSSTASGTGGTGDSTSAGNTASGGVGGSTTGTSGAGAQAGAGGEAGTTNAGGTTNSGGNAGNGGSGGANNTTMGGAGGIGGMAGTGGGTAGTGVVGDLGENCLPPASLACAGYHQKVTLICGASGTWEVNETCGTDEFCDTTPGDNAGTCQLPDAECEGRAVDDVFCADVWELHTCDPDGLHPRVAESCDGVCADDACDNESDPCPVASDGVKVINCGDLRCGSSNCLDSEPWTTYDLVVVRYTYDYGIEIGCGPRRLNGRRPGYSRTRVKVREPWQLTNVQGEEVCDVSGASCIIRTGVGGDFVSIFTDDPAAGARNVMFEPVDEGATCDDL